MPAHSIDHAALPTDDPERFLAFYKRLGFTFLDEDRWRTGEFPLFSLRVGADHIINVHPGPWRPDPHLRGRTAEPGCGDLCFVRDGTVDDVLSLLGRAGIAVTEGPVRRRGARSGGSPSTSVYITDPDGNLIEFMIYDEQATSIPREIP